MTIETDITIYTVPILVPPWICAIWNWWNLNTFTNICIHIEPISGTTNVHHACLFHIFVPIGNSCCISESVDSILTSLIIALHRSPALKTIRCIPACVFFSEWMCEIVCDVCCHCVSTLKCVKCINQIIYYSCCSVQTLSPVGEIDVWPVQSDIAIVNNIIMYMSISNFFWNVVEMKQVLKH